ncbi:flagellar protein FlaG [Marinospirillum insulare]|uniref:Flagellar protein FlaG n=1 Tax=Marinospirillum insulare TaxID=217169 RepID=A0ABQ5ZUT2_9GAMM|nr:flagellar protein FlaG [Marinospirillum insulare]GLR63038.1 hypothetical protein GCM10007878_04730 [Marinospirillum insulare]
MSSELLSLNPAVTTDRPVGSGSSLNNTTTALVPETDSKPAIKSEVSQAETKTPSQLSETLEQESQEILAKKQEETTDSIGASELRDILDEINSALYSYNRSLRFELHEDTDDLVVKVFNTKTDEVIRQYPSEEVLARKAKLLAGDTNFFSTQVS